MQASHEAGAGDTDRSAFDSAAFRQAMGQFLTGVTVVAAVDPDTHVVHAMTANAFMSVSLEPPLVVISVGGATRTHHILQRCTSLGISVLREGQERVALRLAGKAVGGPEVEFLTEDAGPVLRDCLVSVCADISSTVRAGDHTLFVATVTRIHNRHPHGRPLAYHRGRFLSVGPSTGDWPVDIGDAWAGSMHSGWG